MKCIKILIGILFAAFCHGYASADILKIGAATKVITPAVGSWVQGAGVPKRATGVRDDLEANGLYISNGVTSILIVSCDLMGLEIPDAVRIREAMGAASGILPRNILISCTHTHGGPSVVRTNYLMPVDSVYLERLEDQLAQLAIAAVENARPAKIGWAKGNLQIGFNRRLTWADGTHTMHGDATRSDFTGLEGPDDPQHLALFATDMEGQLIALLYHNTTHPAIFYGAGLYSADFPGEARKLFRKKLDNKLPVLFINGAQGDINIQNMLDQKKETPEEQLKRISEMVVNKTMDLYRKADFRENPVLKHVYEDLNVAVRLPAPSELAKSYQVLARIDSGENIRGMEMIMAFGTVHLQESYGKHPFDVLPIHGIRIGDVAIVTQPCELFCQFGLDIKRRSPAPNTIVAGLTDGYAGYCPTIYGVLGGGYTGAPISWTRLAPSAGYEIVETAARLLNNLWPEPAKQDQFN